MKVLSKKKTALVIIVFCLIVLAIVATIVGKVLSTKYGMWQYEVDDFGDIKPSMERMIENFYPYYENASEKENLECITISNHGGKTYTVKYHYKDEAKNKSEEFELTQTQKEDFDKVRDAYLSDYCYFSNLCITENEVYFHAFAPYYIVCTLNQATHKQDHDWFCERISWGWYQCVKIPGMYLD